MQSLKTENLVESNQKHKEIKSLTAVLSFKPTKRKIKEIGIITLSDAAFNILAALTY